MLWRRFFIGQPGFGYKGAGNLLGEEQSGQIRDVGYELYQSMLEETFQKFEEVKLMF